MVWSTAPTSPTRDLTCATAARVGPPTCGSARCRPHHLAVAQDGAYCIPDEGRCDGFINCLDGSDEVGGELLHAASLQINCLHPFNETRIFCPGSLGLWIVEVGPSLQPPQDQLCDGVWQCPDGWDELVGTCGGCSRAGVTACTDGSRCKTSPTIRHSIVPHLDQPPRQSLQVFGRRVVL